MTAIFTLQTKMQIRNGELQEVSIFDALALGGTAAPARPAAQLRLRHAVAVVALSETCLATAHGSQVSLATRIMSKEIPLVFIRASCAMQWPQWRSAKHTLRQRMPQR